MKLPYFVLACAAAAAAIAARFAPLEKRDEICGDGYHAYCCRGYNDHKKTASGCETECKVICLLLGLVNSLFRN